MSDGVAIRAGRDGDLAPLARLYDHYVEHTAITFDLEPFGVEGRRPWLAQFAETGRHRLFVADVDGEAVGFASSHGFRPKGAYATSVETSIYLAPGSTGRGIGARLYDALFDALAREDVHRAYAGITLPNAASTTLHERHGFARVAVFDEVGFKHGRYWSVAWYEKRLR
ncbi:MAG: N-acetyltransferase family protein [Myxococcota bacterium]